MNQQAFDAGKTAYRQGDMPSAIEALKQAKQPGEVSGTVDHLLGNCLMKLGRYGEAASAYADALQDVSYGNAGALGCNRGRALLAAGKPQEAIAALKMAARDAAYPTPYKIQIALGNAYQKIGDARNAGVAFRSAAIDETNPDPSSALSSLGSCFMQMGRAVDAVEAYRTALDFSTPAIDQNAVYADLGMAYVAANRMPEAVDAFTHATADGSYSLSNEASVAFEAAKRASSALAGGSPSETDAMLAAAGYGTAGFDPLDPMGESGALMPSPEDTGFFQVSERELVERDRRDRKVRRKHRHTGLKVFFTLLVLALLVGGAGGFAYYRGYGWPTQESVTERLFTTKASGSSIAELLSDPASESLIGALIPTGTTEVSIDGVDRSMGESSVMATVTLSAGGQQSYRVDLVRDGISWKVSNVEVLYLSQGGTTPSLPLGTTVGTDATATEGTSVGTDGTTPDGTAVGTDATTTDETAAAPAETTGAPEGEVPGSGDGSGDQGSEAGGEVSEDASW